MINKKTTLKKYVKLAQCGFFTTLTLDQVMITIFTSAFPFIDLSCEVPFWRL